MIKIMLDAGHGQGPKDNRGSLIGNEGDNNYAYSLALRDALLKYEGVEVGFTRNNPSDDPSLEQRGTMARGFNIFISLHSNAADSSVRGTEIFDSVQNKNKDLAQALVDAISKAFGHNNRGVKHKSLEENPNRDWYGVLRSSKATDASYLIEHGFHTNMDDCSFYVNERETIAKVTAEVIAKHYGLRPKGDVTDKGANLNKTTEIGGSGVFTSTENIYFRDYPSTKEGKILGLLPKGSKIYYEQYIVINGYSWICWVDGGVMKYIPIREYKGNKFKEMWGSIV